jgi:D-beta-D-heptose 7-phosphate kinase/D-beta-D-heptose 1-phosphate adenosyltransferase
MNRKIHSPDNIINILQKYNSKIIGFTNGCFDIIHIGHIRMLTEIKKNCDILVVALNSDTSIKRLKGDKRPITPLNERTEIIAALECVDFVTYFDEDTPINLILKIKPQILAKGGDWDKANIVGSDIVVKNGGKVLSLDYIKGSSTTNIIDKIVNLYSNDRKF